MAHYLPVDVYLLYTIVWSGLGLNDRHPCVAERSLCRRADHVHDTFLTYLLNILYPRSGRYV